MKGKIPVNSFPTGINHPMFGKVPTSAFSSGAAHPKTKAIYLYSVDNVLIKTFPSPPRGCRR